jgi:hypothetical protein
MFPSILVEAVSYLNTLDLKGSTNNRDGRVNSIEDEKTLIEVLVEKYNDDIEEAKQRDWYDVRMFGFPNQLKSSDYGKKASDNFSAKLALLYALTDMTEEEIYKVRTWSQFERSLRDRRDDNNNRDYYIISMDKKTGECHLSSLKTLNKITPNGNNLPFQIKWSENTQPVQRTGAESWDFLIECGYKPSVRKKLAQHALIDEF